MPKKEVKILINARDNASKKIKMIAGAFAGAFAATRVVDAIKNVIDAADNIGKGAKRIMVTTDEYQKLAHAAKLAGADSSTVETAFKRMSAVVRDAGNGLKDANETLNDLGLTFEDLEGKSTYEQFDLLTAAASNSADKLALIQRIFGRSGQQLLPFIDGFREAGDELERMGGIIDGKVIKSAEAFNDQLTTMKTNAQATVANSGLIEWLADVSDMFSVASASAGGFKWNFLAAAEDMAPGQSAIRRWLFGETANETLARLQKKQLAKINQKTFKKGAGAATGLRDKQLQAEIDDMIDEALKGLDARIAAEEKLKQAGADQISALKQQIQLTNLMNAGKEKEAAIQQEINAARDQGITDEKQLEEIKRLAGLQFDISQKDDKKRAAGMGQAPSLGPEQAFVTRLLSGLSTSNKVPEKTEKNTARTADAVQQTNTLLGTLIAQANTNQIGIAVM